VFAIDSVPGLFEVLSINSSGMFPPPSRLTVSPVGVSKLDPPGGPPVPARLDLGSAECGQPN
jgi:hypothetical protein